MVFIMFLIIKTISKILFTSSNYYVFLFSNTSFILFYIFVLLQEFRFLHFLLGVTAWSGWEYMYHRYMMHYTNTGKIYYYLHGHHHIYPNKNSIHIPLFQYIFVSFFIYGFLKHIVLFTHNENISYTIGHLCSLFIFENTHREIHNPYWVRDANAGFRISHMYHHNKNKNMAFCFTSPTFDILFGTFPDEVLSYNFIAYLPIPYFSYAYGTFPKKISNVPELSNKKTLLIGGGGSKFWHFAGIIQRKIENNKEYIDNLDIIIGVSVGSLLATFVICKCDLNEIKEKVVTITNNIKEKPMLISNCLDIIRDFLQETLPENAYLLCSNKLHIQAIHLYSLSFVCFHTFVSNSDLIDKIMKACHIPVLCNCQITNEGYIDRIIDTGKNNCCNSKNIEIIINKNKFNIKDIFMVADEKFIHSQFHSGYVS